MRIVECTQGEADWLKTRAGRVTASEVADALSILKRKGKDGREAGDSSAVREAYKAAIVGEILSGKSSEHFVSRHMERGTALEPYARQAYEQRHNELVGTVGFILHPTNDRAGASPDGLIGKNGGLEIKVPKMETHIKYIRAGVLPPDYADQVMWNINCAEAEWWDFMSWCPELPERHQQFTVRVPRDDKRIAEMDAGVAVFLEEVDVCIEELNRINPELEEELKKRVPSKNPEENGVVTYPDGREVCPDNAAGKREYSRRVTTAWVAQNQLCALCGKWLDITEATADHVEPRRMGGGFRDDRQENIRAAHLQCNNNRGSKRGGYYEAI